MSGSGLPRVLVLALALAAGASAPPAPAAGALEDELGRSEVRVRSAPWALPEGRTVAACALVRRLEALSYRRVHARPEQGGEFFWGRDVFWIHRRPFRWAGREEPARLLGLALRGSDGRIVGALEDDGSARALEPGSADRLEPAVLAEGLDGDRPPRSVLPLPAFPEHAWRAVLAAEDHRFFEHGGVDPRGIARAIVSNVRAGGVAQGGSTMTQQLVKNRELTPKRTLGRKASEAVRALALEAEHSKEAILEAYLNGTYWGHVGGVAVHGMPAAARAWLGKDAADLDLAESALLAGMIRSPNRLAPDRHPDDARERRDHVLRRMAELGWAAAGDVAAALARPVRAPAPGLPRPPAPHAVAWAAEIAREEAPDRLEDGRGVVVETTLDPLLQAHAEEVIARQLERLRREHGALRRLPLQAALVALDAETGDVLALVGGDPGQPHGGFDRARNARRQPGSTVKPFVLLAAFGSCGGHPLHPAVRVADEALAWPLPTGSWEPENPDGRFRGVVDLRAALTHSLNVPFVRLARHCGLDAVAGTFRAAGLELPAAAPPSFVLGAVEQSPLALARAFAVFATPGSVAGPRLVSRVERPGGRGIARERVRRERVADPRAAWLVRDVLRDAVEEGTAQVARLPGEDVVAKTGTSSDRRDAWMVGEAGGIVTAVWVGLDEGGRLGLTGAQAAGPAWRALMELAVATRPHRQVPRPDGLVRRFVDPRTGLLVGERHRRATEEWFREDALPPRKRFWRADEPVPVIR